MITEEQFAAIKRLIVSENCMIDRFEHYVSEIKEPQLKEDMQKLTAVCRSTASSVKSRSRNLQPRAYGVSGLQSKQWLPTNSLRLTAGP